ncbi:MAG TPA: YHS domain-containing protein [Pyrinomonadaceae bacterium]
MAQHRDPICGMQVDEQNAAGKSEHGGQTYYFCSAGCKTKFDENPEQYAGQAQTGGGQDAA